MDDEIEDVILLQEREVADIKKELAKLRQGIVAFGAKQKKTRFERPDDFFPNERNQETSFFPPERNQDMSGTPAEYRGDNDFMHRHGWRSSQRDSDFIARVNSDPVPATEPMLPLSGSPLRWSSPTMLEDSSRGRAAQAAYPKARDERYWSNSRDARPRSHADPQEPRYQGFSRRTKVPPSADSPQYFPREESSIDLDEGSDIVSDREQDARETVYRQHNRGDSDTGRKEHRGNHYEDYDNGNVERSSTRKSASRQRSMNPHSSHSHTVKTREETSTKPPRNHVDSLRDREKRKNSTAVARHSDDRKRGDRTPQATSSSDEAAEEVYNSRKAQPPQSQGRGDARHASDGIFRNRVRGRDRPARETPYRSDDEYEEQSADPSDFDDDAREVSPPRSQARDRGRSEGRVSRSRHGSNEGDEQRHRPESSTRSPARRSASRSPPRSPYQSRKLRDEENVGSGDDSESGRDYDSGQSLEEYRHKSPSKSNLKKQEPLRREEDAYGDREVGRPEGRKVSEERARPSSRNSVDRRSAATSGTESDRSRGGYSDHEDRTASGSERVREAPRRHSSRSSNSGGSMSPALKRRGGKEERHRNVENVDETQPAPRERHLGSVFQDWSSPDLIADEVVRPLRELNRRLENDLQGLRLDGDLGRWRRQDRGTETSNPAPARAATRPSLGFTTATTPSLISDPRDHIASYHISPLGAGTSSRAPPLPVAFADIFAQGVEQTTQTSEQAALRELRQFDEDSSSEQQHREPIPVREQEQPEPILAPDQVQRRPSRGREQRPRQPLRSGGERASDPMIQVREVEEQQVDAESPEEDFEEAAPTAAVAGTRDVEAVGVALEVAPDAAMALEVERLYSPWVFVKYNFKSTGKRAVQAMVNPTGPWLLWGNPKKKKFSHRVPLSEIALVEGGSLSSVFLKRKKERFVPERCFSVYFRTGRTLDLCAETPEQAQLWVCGLRQLIRLDRRRLGQVEVITCPPMPALPPPGLDDSLELEERPAALPPSIPTPTRRASRRTSRISQGSNQSPLPRR